MLAGLQGALLFACGWIQQQRLTVLPATDQQAASAWSIGQGRHTPGGTAREASQPNRVASGHGLTQQ